MRNMLNAGMAVRAVLLHILASRQLYSAIKCIFKRLPESRTFRDMIMGALPPPPTPLAFPQGTFAIRSHLMAVYWFARIVTSCGTC